MGSSGPVVGHACLWAIPQVGGRRRRSAADRCFQPGSITGVSRKARIEPVTSPRSEYLIAALAAGLVLS